MKISVSYQELGNVINFSSGVLSDKSVEDRLKNVIFLVRDGSVKVCFYTALTFCRTELEQVEVEGVEEGSEWLFQVKAADLMKVLGGFSTLYKTKVESFEFEDSKSKIKVSVTEKAIKEEDARMNQVSVFYLDNVPVLDSVAKDIKMEFPDDADVVPSGDILLYVDSLLPIMTNDSATSTGSKLNFAEDYVFVLTSSMSAFFKNKLPEAFKGTTLGYSSVSLLKKLSSKGDLSVKKLDKYLCVSVEMVEAFMRHQPVKIKYQQFVNRFSRENGMVLNRLYLKDVLRRMGSVSTEGKCTVLENGDLSVENEQFSQVIPVDNTKGSVTGISFKISVPVIEKLIIGQDGVFPEHMFIYFLKVASSYSLFFSDKTGSWFAQTQVR